MSLRVTDLQVLMMRSQEVGKVQQAQQGNEAVQQQSFAEGLIKKSESQRQTVQTTPETGQTKVDGDGVRRDREDAPRKRSDQQQPEENEAEKLTSPFVGTIIDCKI
jgi:biotin carboxyl carrier protein